jgi:hypothetical protein
MEVFIDAKELPATAGRKGGFACFFQAGETVQDGDPGFLFIGTIADEKSHGDWQLQDGEFEVIVGRDGSSNNIWFVRDTVNSENNVEFEFDNTATTAVFDYRSDAHDFKTKMERYSIPNIVLNAGGDTSENPTMQCYYRRFSSRSDLPLQREANLGYWFKVDQVDTTFDSSDCVNNVINLPRFVAPRQPRYPYRMRSVD